MLSKPHAITSDGKYCVVDGAQWDEVTKKYPNHNSRAASRCLCGGSDPVTRALSNTAGIKPAQGSLFRCVMGHTIYALTPYVPEHWGEVPAKAAHDPRILALSDDGQVAALLCADVPEGVKRSSGYTWGKPGCLAQDKLEVAKLVVTYRGDIGYARGPSSHKDPAAMVVAVLVADLRTAWLGDTLRPSTVAEAPKKKIIPDWPLACPKCQRGQSAVLLFQGYDCKHGCYK